MGEIMEEDPNHGLCSLLAEANQALKLAGESLNLGIEGISAVEDFQRQYILQQALSVASVALDVHLLVSHERFQNVVSLCRIAFESRVSIFAAMQEPQFAAQKYLAGAAGHVTELEDMMRGGDTSPRVRQELERQRQLLARMRCDMPGIKEKGYWKFIDVARTAGLMTEYTARYPMLSKAAHSTPTGLAAKADKRIVGSCVLQLVDDGVKTCAALVFFPMAGRGCSQPLTIHWKELTARIDSLQGLYGSLSERFRQLFRSDFPE